MGFWRLPGRPAAPGWGLGFFYLCVWPPPRLLRPILRPAPLLNPPWLPLGPLLNGKQWPWPPAGLPRPTPGPQTRGAGGERRACDAQIGSGCCFTFSSVLPGFGKFWPIWAVILGTGNNAAAPGLARPRPATRGRASWFGAPCVGCCYRTSHATWHHSCTQLCGCCPFKKNEKDPGLAGVVLTLQAALGPCTIPVICAEPAVGVLHTCTATATCRLLCLVH